MAPNIKVYRVHRLLAVLYGLLALLALALVVRSGGNESGPALTMLPAVVVLLLMFSAHFFTARASLKGLSGGRTASRVIACIMLLGFPLGTLIGAYLLINSRHWPDPNEPCSREAALDF